MVVLIEMPRLYLKEENQRKAQIIINKDSRNRDKHVHTAKYKSKDKIKSHFPFPAQAQTFPIKNYEHYYDENRDKYRLVRFRECERFRTSPHSSKRCIECPLAVRCLSNRGHNNEHSTYCRNRKSQTRSINRSHQSHKFLKNSSRSSRKYDKKHKDDAKTLLSVPIPAAHQFISVPVTVPVFYAAYSLPDWAPPQRFDNTSYDDTCYSLLCYQIHPTYK